MNIVNRAFTPAGFAQYVAGLGLPQNAAWARFCVLHNMAPPTLAMRPHGLSGQNLVDLAAFYEGKGWSHGPHLFIDDTPAGIHVFTPLTQEGVHSPSWNHCSWGVEQLGDYDTDDYNSGRGLAVQGNAVAALAVLCHYRGLDSASLKLHRDDPETTHRDCPGASCASRLGAVMDAVHDYITANLRG